MVEVRTVEIGGTKFHVGQLPAMRGIKLLNRLARVLAPALARLAGSNPADIGTLDVGQLGAAAEALFTQLSESELEGILKALLENTQVVSDKGVQPVMSGFDVLFMGKLGDLMELVKTALEVNYGDFLGALGARLRSLAPAAMPSSSKA